MKQLLDKFWAGSEAILQKLAEEGVPAEDAHYMLLVAVGRLLGTNPRFHAFPLVAVIDASTDQQSRDESEYRRPLPEWVVEAFSKGSN